MRLAFIAAEAENVLKRRRRLGSKRKNQQQREKEGEFIFEDRLRRSTSTADDDDVGYFYYWSSTRSSILIERSSTKRKRKWSSDCELVKKKRRLSSSTTRRKVDDDAQRLSSINRRRTLALWWHLTSLSLFFVFAGVAAAAAAANENTMPLLSSSIRSESTGSCNRYEYFLSPSSFSETSTSTSSGLQRNSELTKRSTSPFYAAANPAVDNVFAIWLRASRSSRTWSSSNFNDDLDSPMFVLPMNNNRARHRYQYYFNNYGAGGAGGGSNENNVAVARPSTASGTRVAKLENDEGSGNDDEFSELVSKKLLASAMTMSTNYPQCELFDEERVDELCALEGLPRINKLRRVHIRTNMASNRTSLNLNDPQSTSTTASGGNNNNNFANYDNFEFDRNSTTCNETGEKAPLTLYDFFQLKVDQDVDAKKPNLLDHLSTEFRPCILSAAENNYVKDDSSRRRENYSSNNSGGGGGSGFGKKNSTCRTCYGNILNRLKSVDSRQVNFSVSVLPMLDCVPDNDLEQFSPTSNCSECKVWYRRWLLVILIGIWKQKPCLQWCHLAELACPHLPPVRKNDYAGLPSFRCTDPEIATELDENSTYGRPCNCMHPCDPESAIARWGWKVSEEMPEFCRDYYRRGGCNDSDSNNRKNNNLNSNSKHNDRRTTSSSSSTSAITTTSSTSSSSSSSSTSPTRMSSIISDKDYTSTTRTETSTGEQHFSGNGVLGSSGIYRLVDIWTLTLVVYGFLRWRNNVLR